MNTIEDLKIALSEVKDAMVFADGILKTGPKGHLRVKHVGKVTRYYQTFKGQTDGVYLKQGQENTIKQLEEKAYYSELLKVAKEEKTNLECALRLLEKLPDYRSVFLSIPEEKRHLIGPYEHKPKEKNKEEIMRLFNKKQVPNDYKLITQNGEHVRSKSELIIADRLKGAGVKYFYEDPLVLMGNDRIGTLYWHPDFRVQNPRTGKIYYWEHFGKLDSPDYCNNCQSRMETYAQYGFFPGENLIITTKSSNHGLNLEYVDCLISRYLK